MLQIPIPNPLRPYTRSLPTVTVLGSTEGEARESMPTTHEGRRKHLRNGNGKLGSLLNVCLGAEVIRFLYKEVASFAYGEELIIEPSHAGGAA